MRACPRCGRLYPDKDSGFCQADGLALAAADTVRPSDPGDDRVGSVLQGRYRLFRVVADGGTARVYEALDVSRGQHVAVKVLRRDRLDDVISLERLRREYEYGQRLRAAHVVEAVDFLPTEDGSHALVTEFLSGEELRGLLKRERCVAPARAVRILSQVAVALSAAHSCGLVHRDLKPENLFLCQTQDGDDVRVLDWGSVKDTSAHEPLTVLGTAIGSPFYMSPEQAQGLDTVDRRTDVWSLAVIAYEMLSGRLPFTGPTGPAVLLALITMPAPPLRLGEGPAALLPPSVDAALALGLRKEPSARAESASVFVNALGRALGLEGSCEQWARSPLAVVESQLDLCTPTRVSAEEAFFGAGEPSWSSAAPARAGRARSARPYYLLLGIALGLGALCVAFLLLYR